MSHDRPSRLRRYRAPIGGLVAALALVAGASTYNAVSAAPGDQTAPRSTFAPIEPIRILDTRPALGGAGAIGPDGTLTLKVAGPTVSETTKIPESATAVVLNVTAVLPTADAFLSVLPWSAEVPAALTSNLNFTPNSTVANQVTVALAPDTDGDLSLLIYNAAGVTDVVVDVFGFYEELPV